MDSPSLAEVVTQSIETGVEPERAAIVSLEGLGQESPLDSLFRLGFTGCSRGSL